MAESTCGDYGKVEADFRVERLLACLKPGQLAVLYACIESNYTPERCADDDVGPTTREFEKVLRRIESWAHSEGDYGLSDRVGKMAGLVRRIGLTKQKQNSNILQIQT